MPIFWTILTDASIPIAVGVFFILALVRKGRHLDDQGNLAIEKATSLFAISATGCVFFILLFSHVIVGGPPISELIEQGYGNDTFGNFLIIVLLHYSLLTYSYFVGDEGSWRPWKF